MSCRISVFKINGHDLLACSSVAMKSNNLQGPNENKYSGHVCGISFSFFDGFLVFTEKEKVIRGYAGEWGSKFRKRRNVLSV